MFLCVWLCERKRCGYFHQGRALLLLLDVFRCPCGAERPCWSKHVAAPRHVLCNSFLTLLRDNNILFTHNGVKERGSAFVSFLFCVKCFYRCCFWGNLLCNSGARSCTTVMQCLVWLLEPLYSSLRGKRFRLSLHTNSNHKFHFLFAWQAFV